MARTSNLANVATVSRASKAWYPGGWDFTNGGAITGSLTEYANNIARDGTSGLLVEESSTNEIRNPRAEGAVAGTPGTAPTNWQVNGQTATTSVVGSGYENGWPYIDVRINGTPTGDPFIAFETTTQVSASQGQTWTQSAGIRLVSGDKTNIDDIRFTTVEYTGAGSFLVAADGPNLDVDSSHKRFFETQTLSNASTGAVRPALEINHTSGAIDITLRIYAPQLEKKAFPTSPILPPVSSPAASTRNDDDIEVANGAWRKTDQSGETLYVSFAAPTVSANDQSRLTSYAYLKPSSGSRGIAVGYDRLTSEFEVSLRADNGTVNSRGVASGLTVGANASQALSWDQTQWSHSASGVAQSADNALGGDGFDTPTLLIGRGFPGGSFPGDGHCGTYIKEVRYWPRRLTNSELEALVGN